MKKWLPLLALCLVISGCNGNRDEKAKTQGKQEKQERQATTNVQKIDTPKRSTKLAIKSMERNKRDVVLFLNRAEHLVEQLHYAAASMPNGRALREDDIIYRELPDRFDTKEEVIRYLSRFWSRPLAENIYDNLPAKIIKGKVYLSSNHTDYPVLISVRNTEIRTDDRGITAIVNDITLPAFSRDRRVRYRIERDERTKRYEIKKRLGTYGREQFE